MKLCLIDGCGRVHRCLGYCAIHYRRMRKWGDPHFTLRRRVSGTLDERIAMYTVRRGDCLVFTGPTTDKGYGVLHIKKDRFLVHRVMCEKHNGPPPSSTHLALHSCDNPPCCEPTHLRWGTYGDNNQDALARGRQKYGDARGERNGHAKVTAAQVLECRRRYAAGESANVLALAYGVTASTVRQICNRSSWRHLP